MPYRRFILITIAICLFLLGYSCVPTEYQNEIPFDINTKDRTTKRIHDFSVDRNYDSLEIFLSHENPNYRYNAVKGIATYSGYEKIDSVVPLLSDKYYEISTYAAYALGKSGNNDYVTDLIQAFDNTDSLKRKIKLNSNILEAIGKVGGEQELYMLSTIANYRGSDTLLLLGQMRGILEFINREINDKITFKELGKIVSNPTYPDLVKAYAAVAIGRQKDFAVDSLFYELKSSFKQTDDKNLKIAILKAISSCVSASCQSLMLEVLENEKDQDLRLIAFNSVTKDESTELKTFVSYLSDKNKFISEIAALYIYKNGNSQDAEKYIKWAQKYKEFPNTQGKLYAAGLKFLPYYYAVTKAQIFNEVKTHFANTKNPYNKIPYLLAIAEDPNSYKWLIENGLKSQHAILRNKASIALLDVIDNKHFKSIFRGQSGRVKKEIIAAINNTVNKLDAGIISELGQKSVTDKIPQDIEKAIIAVREKLLTPETYEAYYFASKVADKDIEKNPAPFLEIDTMASFDSAKTYLAEINTTQGDITIRLMPDIAPVTVANFLSLAENDYYSKKYFHRVVPSFVIQTGCNRGDGYGSLDYVIPTETGMVYYDKPGMVGMASLGNDTESAQFFITHTMTPHLNGRYTIFAEVVEGMHVVGKMSVGDAIKSITISKI